MARLSPALIEQLLQSGSWARYPRNTIILLERNGPGAAFIESGLLRCFVVAADGRQMTVRYSGPGHLVGSLTSEPSNLGPHLQAVEPSVLIHLDVHRVRLLAAQHPELALALHDEMSRRLPHVINALSASAFATVESRVARDLVQRMRVIGPLRTGVRLKVTQQDLADAAGSVREVVARALHRMRLDGIIATENGRLTILDPDALARLAGTMT